MHPEGAGTLSASGYENPPPSTEGEDGRDKSRREACWVLTYTFHEPTMQARRSCVPPLWRIATRQEPGNWALLADLPFIVADCNRAAFFLRLQLVCAPISGNTRAAPSTVSLWLEGTWLVQSSAVERPVRFW